MEETYQLTSALKYLEWGKEVALVTDGRFSGGTAGACIGHVSPEAAEGGPICLIRTGDINIYPVNNAIGTVVHAAERSNIDTVIISGRVRKRGGVVLGVDQATLRAAVDESCAHLFNAAGYRPDLFAESFAPIHQA